jgi:hypothetical protein
MGYWPERSREFAARDARERAAKKRLAKQTREELNRVSGDAGKPELSEWQPTLRPKRRRGPR